MSPAERLLTELRTGNVRVRLDGGGTRCKDPDGVIPADLAQRIEEATYPRIAVNRTLGGMSPEPERSAA